MVERDTNIYGIGARILPSSLFEEQETIRNIVERLQNGEVFIFTLSQDVDRIKSQIPQAKVSKIKDGFVIYLG